MEQIYNDLTQKNSIFASIRYNRFVELTDVYERSLKPELYHPTVNILIVHTIPNFLWFSL